MDWPTPAQLDETIAASPRSREGDDHRTGFEHAAGGNPIPSGGSLDELRVAGRVESYTNGLPAVVQQHSRNGTPICSRVGQTPRRGQPRDLLGRDDGDSWLNNWPVKGRTAYPLLFDRNRQPKPAFNAVIQTSRLPQTPQKPR